MAEGELDVDSLISRLLEGEFLTFHVSYHVVRCFSALMFSASVDVC